MRCLCLFVHYFNPQGPFGGRSKKQDPQIRQGIVERALFSLRSLKDIDVRVCGHSGCSLVPVDFDLSDRTSDPQFLVYESLQMLQDFKYLYDYFLVVEDDILLSPDILRNVFAFDREYAEYSEQRWIFHPNRIEYLRHQTPFCIDLAVVRRRVGDPICFENRMLQEHENPHSGLLMVNRAKLDIIFSEVDLNFRDFVIGGPMASAFAHYHKPFRLFRCIDGLDFHTIQHLDPMDWKPLSIPARGIRLASRILSSTFKLNSNHA
jgi:hypothetical protein